MSYKLDSFFGKDKDQADQTASLKPAALSAPPQEASVLENDLAYARAAAIAMLGRPEKDASEPWSNPATGARGMVTPIADAYTQDGFTCRDFLASYIRDGAESWLQGDGCRIHQGEWTIRKLRPLKRS